MADTAQKQSILTSAIDFVKTLVCGIATTPIGLLIAVPLCFLPPLSTKITCAITAISYFVYLSLIPKTPPWPIKTCVALWIHLISTTILAAGVLFVILSYLKMERGITFEVVPSTFQH